MNSDNSKLQLVSHILSLLSPTQVNSGQQRHPWVDYAKGIAIILVVYRHMLGGYQNAGIEVAEYYIMAQQSVYNFRMPLFFLLSGIFLKKSLSKRSTSAFVSYKANSIMYPYLIWASLQLSIQVLFTYYANGNKSWSDFAYLLYAPRELDQFWFLYTIFNITIIYAITYRYAHLRTTAQLGLAAVFYYVSTLTFVQPIGLLQDTLQYYLYFAIGGYTADFVLSEKANKSFSATTLVGLLPIFLLSQWYWITHQDLRSTQPFAFAVIAIVGSAFVINIAFVLGRAQRMRVLKLIGRHSLYIYIMHVILLGFVKAVLVVLLKIDNVILLFPISMIVATAGPIIFYRMSVKYGFWPLFTTRRPRALAPQQSTSQ